MLLVVDGSNVGKVRRPSLDLDHLRTAIRELSQHKPDSSIIVVIDRSDVFADYVAPRTREEAIEGERQGEWLIPPTNVENSDDRFVLSFAEQHSGMVVSNDGYRKHLTRFPWLTHEGRLLGADFHAAAGWVFVPRKIGKSALRKAQQDERREAAKRQQPEREAAKRQQPEREAAKRQQVERARAEREAAEQAEDKVVAREVAERATAERKRAARERAELEAGKDAERKCAAPPVAGRADRPETASDPDPARAAHEEYKRLSLERASLDLRTAAWARYVAAERAKRTPEEQAALEAEVEANRRIGRERREASERANLTPKEREALERTAKIRDITSGIAEWREGTVSGAYPQTPTPKEQSAREPEAEANHHGGDEREVVARQGKPRQATDPYLMDNPALLARAAARMRRENEIRAEEVRIASEAAERSERERATAERMEREREEVREAARRTARALLAARKAAERAEGAERTAAEQAEREATERGEAERMPSPLMAHYRVEERRKARLQEQSERQGQRGEQEERAADERLTRESTVLLVGRLREAREREARTEVLRIERVLYERMREKRFEESEWTHALRRVARAYADELLKHLAEHQVRPTRR